VYKQGPLVLTGLSTWFTDNPGKTSKNWQKRGKVWDWLCKHLFGGPFQTISILLLLFKVIRALMQRNPPKFLHPCNYGKCFPHYIYFPFYEQGQIFTFSLSIETRPSCNGKGNTFRTVFVTASHKGTQKKSWEINNNYNQSIRTVKRAYFFLQTKSKVVQLLVFHLLGRRGYQSSTSTENLHETFIKHNET